MSQECAQHVDLRKHVEHTVGTGAGENETEKETEQKGKKKKAEINRVSPPPVTCAPSRARKLACARPDGEGTTQRRHH